MYGPLEVLERAREARAAAAVETQQRRDRQQATAAARRRGGEQLTWDDRVKLFVVESRDGEPVGFHADRDCAVADADGCRVTPRQLAAAAGELVCSCADELVADASSSAVAELERAAAMARRAVADAPADGRLLRQAQRVAAQVASRHPRAAALADEVDDAASRVVA